MIPLPVANILHHKLRSALSALGVAIAVCMLITLAGLSRGTLMEIADRWDAVDADLIVYSARWGDNIITASGAGLGAADVEKVAALADATGPFARRTAPVYIFRVAIGGDEHNVVGVDPDRIDMFLAGQEILPGGRVFDPDGRFAAWLRGQLSQPAAGDKIVDITEADLAAHGGLEMIVDSRLAKAAKLRVGDSVFSAGHHFEIVGIVPAGAMARAFIPRATAEYLFNGRLGRFTLMFVKLREGVRVGAAAEAIRGTGRLTAVAVNEYRGMLVKRLDIMYIYVDAVNTVVLVVAFLFILVTLYTMVLQRTREIAILKSMGAGGWYILREVMVESLMLSALGAAAGALAAPGAGWLIEMVRPPLLTVDVNWKWIGIAVGAAGAGGMLASLYPAWFALRVDMIEALTQE